MKWRIPLPEDRTQRTLTLAIVTSLLFHLFVLVPFVVVPGLCDLTCANCLAGRENLCRHYRLMGEHASGGGLMSLQLNLMFWTLLIFVILYIILSKFAFGPITAAVEAREKALEEAIEAAKRDREAAAKLLQEHAA